MKRTRRSPFRRRLTAALGATLVLSSMFMVSASAAPSGFLELDNNIVDDSAPDPPYDWANSGALTTPSPISAAGTWSRAGDGGIFNGGAFVNNTTVPTAPAQVTSNATIVDADFKVDPMSVHVTNCGSGDPSVFTGQGSEKNGGLLSGFTYATGSTPNKDDLANTYAIAHVDGAVNEIFFGAERVVNDGDSHIDFEFLQSEVSLTGTCAGSFVGDRSQGDLLLVVDFTRGGELGGSQIYEWHCTAEGGAPDPAVGTVCNPPTSGKSTPHYQADNNSAVVFGVNAGETPIECGGWVCLNADGSPRTTLAKNLFMEGGIDLAQLGFTGCISTLLPHTRSSQSFTATLKDFEIIDFNTCGNPEIVTTPDPDSGTVGQVDLNDDATLSGGSNPSGDITFNLYGPDDPDCEGTPVFTQTVTVNGNGDYGTTGGPTADVAGTWNWTADYSGDSRNPAASSGCGEEAVTIAPATPSLVTTPDPTSGVVGVTIPNDSGALSGGYNPTGSITFNLFDPDDPDCEGTPRYTQTVTVNGNGTYVTTNTTFIVDKTGTWNWTADYSGDDNNDTASSACGDELVVISPDSPTLTTTPSDGGVVGVTTLNDTATLAGGFAPTGTITFNLYAPGDPDCEGTPVYTDAVTVAGNGDYSTDDGGFLANETGTYHWTADYSGDDNNGVASSGCAAEPVVITPDSPTITTTPSDGGVVGLTTLNDTATLADGFEPTGTITFNLYAPADPDCEGTPVYTDAVTVAGNGDYSTDDGGFLANETGTYHWTADYSGDDNNGVASSGCAAEPVVISPDSPTITTTPDPAGPVVLGTTLNDTATLAGGFEPTGTITFNLYAPADPECEGSPVYTDDVTVSGNGDYSTDDGGYVTIATGTYHWTATYGGDANNNGASSGCAEEPVVIIAPSTVLTKTAAVTTTVVYTYAEENDGSVALTAPNVTDPECVTAGGTVEFSSGDADSNDILDPGETWLFTCTATYSGPGTFTNVATGHGLDPLGLDVTHCADVGSPPDGVRCDQDEQDSVTVTVTVEEAPAQTLAILDRER